MTAETKQASSKMVELVALTHIRHNGNRYAEGEKFEATEPQAEALLRSGSAQTFAMAKAAAAKLKPVKKPPGKTEGNEGENGGESAGGDQSPPDGSETDKPPEQT